MKVTFISPFHINIWEALGLGYIASYCKKHYKKEATYNFLHGNFDSFGDIMRQAVSSDIIGISCTTPTFQTANDIANSIKIVNPKAHIVLGGWHPTVIKTINTPWIDQIVVGEGEKAFLDIMNGNRDKVVYGKKLTFSSLLWPDRELIQYGRQVEYCEKNFGERIASIQSVRGCKMHCAMCAERCMTGAYDSEENPLRLRLPMDTMREVCFLQDKYKINRFKFVDPTWSVSEDYVANFCFEKIRIGNYLPWDAMVHAGIVTEMSLKIMSKANCDVIMVGCESGSQKILNDIKKGLTVEKIKKVFGWGRKYGLKRRAFFMIGMPNESNDTIQETINLIKEIDPDTVGFTILAPFPGTEFYDAEKFKDVDWSKVDEYENDFWCTKNFTNQELKNIQKELCEMFKDKLPWHQKHCMGMV